MAFVSMADPSRFSDAVRINVEGPHHAKQNTTHIYKEA
jgi:hypothetical protein